MSMICKIANHAIGTGLAIIFYDMLAEKNEESEKVVQIVKNVLGDAGYNKLSALILARPHDDFYDSDEEDNAKELQPSQKFTKGFVRSLDDQTKLEEIEPDNRKWESIINQIQNLSIETLTQKAELSQTGQEKEMFLHNEELNRLRDQFESEKDSEKASSIMSQMEKLLGEAFDEEMKKQSDKKSNA